MNTEEPVLKRQKLEDSEKEAVGLVPQSQVPQAKQHLYKTKYILKGHTKPVTCARFSPDGKLIATACRYRNTVIFLLIYFMFLIVRIFLLFISFASR